MFLVSQRDQTVSVEALEARFHFARGERLHTESSYKYAPREIDDLARDAGFALRRRWLDGRQRYSLNLLTPLHAPSPN
jgi:uncharacterized SAM-dependent methyltransferase